MKSKTEVSKEFKDRRRISENGLAMQLENSVLCDAFYDGDYMSYKDSVFTPSNKKVGVEFNKIQPYVNSVSGFMIQTRTRAKYYSRLRDPQQRAMYTRTANGVADYVRSNTRAEQVESQQDQQMLIKGYGAVETEMTYGEGYATTDPNGEILMDDVTNDTRWDPAARKKNLADAKWIYYKRSYNLRDAEALFSDADEEDFDSRPPIDNEHGYQFDPTIGYPYDRSREMPAYSYDWDSKDNRTVWVYFYQWCETEKFYRADNPVYKLTNPAAIEAAMLFMDQLEEETEQEDSLFKFDVTAQTLTFDSATKKKLEDQFGEFIKPFPYNRKVFYKAVLSGNKVFKVWRSQTQQGYTIKVKTGIWNNTKRIWIGMVNAMMEPAKYYNKGLTELMYMIATNSKGGWFVEDDATNNIRKFEADVARTNAVITLRPGGLLKVREKKTPFAPSGYDNIIGLAEGAVGDASGIDKNFLTMQSGSGNMTAQLHRQIIKQVMSTLAPYFDARDNYQEEHARLMLDFMRVYAENNVGLIIRIAGDQGVDEFLELSDDPFNAEYDIKTEEAPDTDEEQQQELELLIAMGDKLLAVGDPSGKNFYRAAISKMKLDDEEKKELSQSLAPSEDPRISQLETQLQQLSSQQTQKQLALIDAQTANLLAGTSEKQANVQKKAAEIAEIGTDIDQKTLENAVIARGVPQERVSVSL